jgi:hypothetical protein
MRESLNFRLWLVSILTLLLFVIIKKVPMSDRPDFDPEKNFETIRAQWTKESHLSLPSKLETRLTLIEEQLSALFQLAQKSLGDQIDGAIDRDFKNSKLEELFFAIIKLEERVGKLETR